MAKKIKVFIVLSFISFVLFSTCDIFLTNEDMIGTYVFNKQLNTFDTLIIYQNGIYKEKLYNSKKKLVYSNTGKWKKFNGSIYLNDLLSNQDWKFPENEKFEKEDLMGYSLPKEKYFGEVRLVIDFDQRKYYKKVN